MERPTRQLESRMFSALSEEEVKNSIHHRVFVYGTLRFGEKNHWALMNHTACVFAGTGKIRADKFETTAGFPCVVEGLGLVDGEVYQTDDKGLKALDRFEGTPDLYVRKEVNLVGKDENPTGEKVFVYFGNHAADYIIPNSHRP